VSPEQSRLAADASLLFVDVLLHGTATPTRQKLEEGLRRIEDGAALSLRTHNLALLTAGSSS